MISELHKNYIIFFLKHFEIGKIRGKKRRILECKFGTLYSLNGIKTRKKKNKREEFQTYNCRRDKMKYYLNDGGYASSQSNPWRST
jgi:hypothetical protein